MAFPLIYAVAGTAVTLLVFGKILIGPRYAILDEATSALDIANEESLYRLLAASSTTLLSVGHRPS